MTPWILGISASHNGAACLLHGDRIVVAVQEERLSRRKRDRVYGSRPSLAVTYCLRHAGITVRDLNMIVFTAQNSIQAPENDITINPQLRVTESGVPHLTIPHHFAHAMHAWATSGFDDAAVLVVDGMGSPYEDLGPEERRALLEPSVSAWETISLYKASGILLSPLEKHSVQSGAWLVRDGSGMPRFGSLGGMYSAVGHQIFGSASAAGKVMGLAASGLAMIPSADFFELTEGKICFRDTVPKRFQHDERWPDRAAEYATLASSVQAALEQALLWLAHRLYTLSGSARLCYAGGVALNGIANERLIRETDFDELHAVPAAEDNGPAIGAAYYGLWQFHPHNTHRPSRTDSLGRSYPKTIMDKALASAPWLRKIAVDDLVAETAARLRDGQVGGWFQGGSEFGPRALGSRSILCDPRKPDGASVINNIKRRENFRPFAPAILLEHVQEWFDLDGMPPDSPYMLRVLRFYPDMLSSVPAVVHADGTGRVQTVTKENGLFYDVLVRFWHLTGIPMLLNTSFNVSGEPIVETPDDALWCFLETDLDFCVLGPHLVVKDERFTSVLDLRPIITASPAARHASNPIPPNSEVPLVANTPWGTTTRFITPTAVALLDLVDGHRTGREIQRIISARTGKKLEERLLVRIFSELRRESIIRLEEIVT
ncbi:MAG: carbamoyltransferase family protein [Pseudonocardiaceae bacterium]